MSLTGLVCTCELCRCCSRSAIRVWGTHDSTLLHIGLGNLPQGSACVCTMYPDMVIYLENSTGSEQCIWLTTSYTGRVTWPAKLSAPAGETCNCLLSWKMFLNRGGSWHSARSLDVNRDDFYNCTLQIRRSNKEFQWGFKWPHLSKLSSGLTVYILTLQVCLRTYGG